MFERTAKLTRRGFIRNSLIVGAGLGVAGGFSYFGGRLGEGRRRYVDEQRARLQERTQLYQSEHSDTETVAASERLIASTGQLFQYGHFLRSHGRDELHTRFYYGVLGRKSYSDVPIFWSQFHSILIREGGGSSVLGELFDRLHQHHANFGTLGDEKDRVRLRRNLVAEHADYYAREELGPLVLAAEEAQLKKDIRGFYEGLAPFTTYTLTVEASGVIGKWTDRFTEYYDPLYNTSEGFSEIVQSAHASNPFI